VKTEDVYAKIDPTSDCSWAEVVDEVGEFDDPWHTESDAGAVFLRHSHVRNVAAGIVLSSSVIGYGHTRLTLKCHQH